MNETQTTEQTQTGEDSPFGFPETKREQFTAFKLGAKILGIAIPADNAGPSF